MEFGDEERRIDDVFLGLPSTFGDWIVLPVDQVFQLVVADSGVDYFFNFIFGGVVDNNRWKGFRSSAGDGIRCMRSETGDMENGMDLHGGWEVEAVCAGSNFAYDLVWSDASEIQLLGWAFGGDVGSVEENGCANGEVGIIPDMLIVLSFVPFLRHGELGFQF